MCLGCRGHGVGRGSSWAEPGGQEAALDVVRMSEPRARTAGGRGPGACPVTPKLRRSPRSCRDGCCALTCGRLVENPDAGRPLVRIGRQPDNLVGRTLVGDMQG